MSTPTTGAKFLAWWEQASPAALPCSMERLEQMCRVAFFAGADNSESPAMLTALRQIAARGMPHAIAEAARAILARIDGADRV